jgi:hypothetical protein
VSSVHQKRRSVAKKKNKGVASSHLTHGPKAKYHRSTPVKGIGVTVQNPIIL